MAFIDDLRLKFKTATSIEKLIAVNVLVLLAYHVIGTMLYLFKLPMDVMDEWLFFSKVFEEYIFRPWTIITYAFFHDGLWHILVNMLILYFSGRYFIIYFTQKRVLTVYLLGGIAGALLYMLAYNLFPAFEGVRDKYLLGASASVMAILIATAAYVPNLEVRLMFIGSVKFWWIAVFFVAVDVIQIPVNNAGGHIAHLGGALFGYLYAIRLKKGTDIGSGFEKLMDAMASMFKPRKKSPLKTVHKAKKTKTSSSATSAKGAAAKAKNPNQAQIDAILDKISKSGYDSLTKQEKDFLFKAGRD